MKVILRQMRVALESRKVTFAVMLLPSISNIQDSSEFEKERIPIGRCQIAEDIAAQICRSENIQYLDLRKSFLAARDHFLYDPKDGHLSLTGNRYAASLVKDFILDLYHES